MSKVGLSWPLLLIISLAFFSGIIHAAETPANATSDTLKIMVVGDSITHGMGGDFTWRYRLWQWFQTQTDVSIEFVGPFIGTNPNPPPIVPEGEPDPCPCDYGRYHEDVDPGFIANSNHYAVWGRQLAQTLPHIENVTREYQPDLILLLMGFNDLAWFISDADELAESMREFITNVRKATPDMHFAISDVSQRSSIDRWDLVTNTVRYRYLLPPLLRAFDSPESPTKFVELSEVWECQPAWCPAGYGGLHPNALGEYEIAHAFSKTLHDSYGYGTGYLQIPAWDEVPLRNVSVPGNFTAGATEPGTILLTWDLVPGANSYSIGYRIAGDDGWSHPWRRSDQLFYVHAELEAGVAWEFKIRSEYGAPDQGGRIGNWSEPISAVAL